ncbi:unnamed protein product [Caenorhabditis bovis]|uniref:C2H2-type domain-containing protein n=1 Tax=Caenorhabditis bovis TaxID=2654633 RepID=A0A8S1EAR9_9PELO|nr:unnamed protein product [Caenorhabditis bovis]
MYDDIFSSVSAAAVELQNSNSQLWLGEVCNEFSENLQTHLESHYRTCTGRNAGMECRFCPREFRTVAEVMEHESLKHTAANKSATKGVLKCSDCNAKFSSTYALQSHRMMHIGVHEVWGLLQELQYEVGVIRNGKVKNIDVLDLRSSDEIDCEEKMLKKVKTETAEEDSQCKREPVCMEKIENIQIKQEVKTEIIDDEYPTN